MGKRGWGILIAVIALAAVVAIVVAVLATSNDSPTDAATPSPSEPAVTPPPTDEASPAPTSITPAAVVTCLTTSTTEFQQLMAQNGWISWETQDEEFGARPFDRFPGGAPAGEIVCRWGVSPDLATDNVLDLAWSAIPPDAAAAAQSLLGTEGFERIDSPEGVYYALVGSGDRTDAEGWGESYLFTTDDVRWAPTKADLAAIKAPDEEG